MKKPIFISLLLTLLLSCASDREATIINQEASIDSYITSKFSDSLVVRSNGSNRIVMYRDTSAHTIKDSLAFGDSIWFYYAGYTFSNGAGSLFCTNLGDLSADFPVTNPDYSPQKMLFTENSMIPGLVNGMSGMKINEYSIIVFSARYGFNNTKVYNIPKLSPLIYQVVLDTLIKN